MALHDYRCTLCGAVFPDVYRPISIGAQADPPHCPACRVPTAWIPAIGAIDALEPNQEFVTYDGQDRPVLVESFAQMRKLERDSEQQYRNGEGQPLRFRALHQNRSNKDVNSFGEAPTDHPTDAGKRRFGLGTGASPLDGSNGAPDVAYGPGVHDGNASALKESPV